MSYRLEILGNSYHSQSWGWETEEMGVLASRSMDGGLPPLILRRCVHLRTPSLLVSMWRRGHASQSCKLGGQPLQKNGKKQKIARMQQEKKNRFSCDFSEKTFGKGTLEYRILEHITKGWAISDQQNVIGNKEPVLFSKNGRKSSYHICPSSYL